MKKKNYYNLIAQMTITEFKLKYAGSVLGYVWSLFKPLLLFAVLYIVFSYIFKLGKSIPNYPIYLLLGIVMWTFFVEATMNGMNSIVGRGDLIRKVNFPKIIIVLAAVLNAVLTFILNLVVVAIFLIFSKITPTLAILAFLPVLFEFILFTIGVTLILTTLYTKFRDFSHIWEVGLQVLFYGTPFIYPVSLIPEKLSKLIMLNPLSQVVQDARWAVVSRNVETSWQILGLKYSWFPLAIVLLVFIAGVVFFLNSAKNFAEEI